MSIAVFDTELLYQRRLRAAKNPEQYDFLLREVADRLYDRLSIVKKDLPQIADIGSAHGVLSQLLSKRQGTREVIAIDTVSFTTKTKLIESEILPPEVKGVDAIVSNLFLHWVNDLPGMLIQIKQALKSDGVFLAALLGGDTLNELRQCLMEAELQVTGGVSPRISPFIDAHDMGALMQRAGFALPVIDSEKIVVEYGDALRLMHDLRGMGATNATFNRLKRPTKRLVILEAARLYQEKYANAEGRIAATFDVIYAIGWRPHESQPQPLKPGSAKNKLADALKVVEFKTGDKAKP